MVLKAVLTSIRPNAKQPRANDTRHPQRKQYRTSTQVRFGIHNRRNTDRHILASQGADKGRRCRTAAQSPGQTNVPESSPPRCSQAHTRRWSCPPLQRCGADKEIRHERKASTFVTRAYRVKTQPQNAAQPPRGRGGSKKGGGVLAIRHGATKDMSPEPLSFSHGAKGTYSPPPPFPHITARSAMGSTPGQRQPGQQANQSDRRRGPGHRRQCRRCQTPRCSQSETRSPA